MRTSKTTRAVLSAAALLVGCDAAPVAPAPKPVPSAPAAPSAPSGPRFEECAEKVGLKFRTSFLPLEQGENFNVNLYDHGCGLAAADFDGDGHDDLYVLNQLGPNALYRNRGDGTFEDVTEKAGVALDGRISVAAAFGDADGDGDPDLYVTTTRGGNAYFENLGEGRFRDGTKEAGLRLVEESMGATFFDMDGDGDLDLLVTNSGRWTLDAFNQDYAYYQGKRNLAGVVKSEPLHNVLYRNDGKAHFTDVTDEAGMQGKGWADDAEIFDMDGDGDPDVYVTNMFGANALYRNDGKGRFTDVAATALGKTSWGAMGARAFDYDGDGRLDLFVTDMHSDMWIDSSWSVSLVEPKVRYPSFLAHPVALGLQSPAAEKDFEALASIRNDEVLFGNTLFRNRGDGTFEEVSGPAGAETFWPWGIAEGDFDGDGHVDAFLPAGMGYPFFFWPNSLLRNRGNGTFEDVAAASGTAAPPGGDAWPEKIRDGPAYRSARCAATGDFDEDGRLDLVVSTFNDRLLYYRNVSPPGAWCELRLVGAGANRAAVGAVARLTVGGKVLVRQVQSAGGYLSQNSNRLHFGLGAAKGIDRLEIRWPDGRTEVVASPPVGRITTITESTK